MEQMGCPGKTLTLSTGAMLSYRPSFVALLEKSQQVRKPAVPHRYGKVL